jgi:signal transduction histidine kinase
MAARYVRASAVEALPSTRAFPDPALALCHDLRQPVAAIIMLAAAAAAQGGVPEGVQQRLEQIAAEAEWLGRMVTDVLDASAVEQRVDLRDVVADIVDEARATACKVEFASTHPMFLQTNATLARRAITNLLDNATRAAGSGGRVRVDVRRTAELAVIEVEDAGPGYGRIEAHTGFGLGVVRLLASRHGGSVLIGQSRLGGARVRLALPIDDQGSRD